MTLEQIQEKAREHIVDIQSAAYNTVWLENKLNNIVTEVWNEAIKECDRCKVSNNKKYKMKLPKEKYPICPECGEQMVAGAHMTSDDSRSIYCTNARCNYDVAFEDLTTPVPPPVESRHYERSVN